MSNIGGITNINNCYCPNNQYWNGASCTGCLGGSSYYATPPDNIGETAVANNCYCPNNQYWNGASCTGCLGGSSYYATPPGNIGETAVANKCYCPNNQYWKGTSCASCTGNSTYYPGIPPNDVGGVVVANKCYCAPGSTYVPLTKECAPCRGNCLSCTYPYFACNKCSQNTFLYNNACYDKCPTFEYIFNTNICVTSCPSGTMKSDGSPIKCVITYPAGLTCGYSGLSIPGYPRGCTDCEEGTWHGPRTT
ncbi:MAG: hypothetical protein ACR2HS_04145, partial [Gammaproteobacteria bacterium]